MIYDDILLVGLSIGFWTGKSRLDPDDLKLSKKDIPDFYMLGSKYLIDAEKINEFYKLSSHYRSIFYDLTLPFPIGSARIIPLDQLEKISEFFKEGESVYMKKAEEFVNSYNNLKKKALAQYKKFFEKHDYDLKLLEKIEKLYPSKEKILSKFYFDYLVTSLKDSKDILLAKHKNLEDFVNKASLEVNKVVNVALEDLYKTIVECCDRIKTSAEGKPITESRKESITKMLNRVQSLNFVKYEPVEEAVESIKKLIAGEITPGIKKEAEKISRSLSDIFENLGDKKIVKLE